jgi:hypothetical protein
MDEQPHQPDQSERGRRASFDRKTGEVHGSGSGAGGAGNPAEDYDGDSAAGSAAEPAGGPRPAGEAEQAARDRRQGDEG